MGDNVFEGKRVSGELKPIQEKGSQLRRISEKCTLSKVVARTAELACCVFHIAGCRAHSTGGGSRLREIRKLMYVI